MKGLFVKDMCLMLQRKRSFIIILLCGLAISFSSDDAFFIGWMVIIGVNSALSTIAYDEHDNSYAFLLTMPVTRRSYVCEKYIFGSVIALVFWMAGVLINWGVDSLKGVPADYAEEITAYIFLLLIPLFILDLCIPLNLKYGSEKGRVYLLVLWGIIFAVVLVFFKFIPGTGIKISVPSVSRLTILTAAVVATAAVTAVSVRRSFIIMENKEF